MSKSDIFNNNLTLLTKRIYKKRKKESPILNLSDTSFLYNKKSNTKIYLPNLNNQENKKLNSSVNSIKGNIKEIKSSLLNLKQNNKSKIYINNGIIWYNDSQITIPKLLFQHGKINLVNNISTERKLYLSKIKNKMYSTRRMEELFFQKNNQDKLKINEVLQLKKDNNNLNINNNKDNNIFDKLLTKLGISKYEDDKLIKKIKVGKINKKTKFRNESQIFKKKTKKNLLDSRNDKINKIEKYFNKNDINLNNKIKPSSSVIISKKEFNDNSIKNKKIDYDEKIKYYQYLHIKNINKKMIDINGEFKNIDNKINEYYNRAKEKFDNDVKKIFPNF